MHPSCRNWELPIGVPQNLVPFLSLNWIWFCVLKLSVLGMIIPHLMNGSAGLYLRFLIDLAKAVIVFTAIIE
jgi:hypothetical protein